MRNATFTTFSSLALLCSCSSSPTDLNSKADTVATKNATSAQSVPTNRTIDKSKLLGVWWNSQEKDAPHASFAINDSTIFYPDQEGKSEFKYEIKGDSLIIYFQDYINSSHIDKLTENTLELTTDGEKSLFWKNEK